ncbi:hypothetical protein TTRE_0000952901 [Trichuris trichiura]|uniref:Uncharacterized protein n=1 Tax=Trichuris trichiura TaxID=36087 RepID=A0A077ZL94_TRITR|nr:hypothetical protein TTRE_0000952901 [Trichuris trichiura]
MRWFESSYPSLFAGVAELADALDSKSSVRKDVPVRPRPPGNGGCGEVVNASDCGSDTRGFDSHHSP